MTLGLNAVQTSANLNRAATRAMQARDFAGAEGLLTQALEADGANLSAWMNLAGARRARGGIEDALKAADQAIRLAPRCFPALLMRASLLERLGRTTAAAEAYGVALTIAPPSSQLDAATAEAAEHGRQLNARHLDAVEGVGRDAIRANSGGASPQARGRAEAFLLNALGRGRRYVQEPTHFYYPGLPATPFYPREQTPWLGKLEAATAEIRRELESLIAARADFTPYVDYGDGVPLDQWAALNRSLDWSAFHLLKDGVPVPGNADACPRTLEVLKHVPQPDLPGRSPAAMFSAMKPHTRLPAHTGVSNTRLVCHLPLIVPQGCGFRVADEVREWRVGEGWVFDDTIEHEAWNDGPDLRVILICDVWSPWLTEDDRRLIQAVTAALDAGSEDAGGSQL